MVNTILKEADLFCPNSVRINFTIYHITYTYTSLILVRTFTIPCYATQVTKITWR
ncbi:ABC transporter ATP-binding protein [Lactiplantibacillus plantarum]|nr:ABC transporter ATP-binding protein [Lactiplantibacillus plantarum]QBX95451.1 ABC transporter ATP-binding protein [Lactiplantibacillus plantarum]